MQYPLHIWLKVDDTYEKLDLFKDEGITVKESVKNFDDIKKVFTSVSRSFTVPASKKNNKILGHFYRGDLFGVDSRALIDAKLTLNDVDYKFGNVSLEDAKFKNGELNSYTLRFYGNLTELSKKIGEDELTDLDLSAYDISNPDLFSEFEQLTLTRKAVAFPLMSKYRRFISHSTDYDYAKTQGYTNVANISYSTATREQGYYGVTTEDLVGAIWCGSILDAIEDKYGINFTGILGDAKYARELRLLLQKRGSDGLSGSTLINKAITNFTPSNTYNRFSSTSNGFSIDVAYLIINASTSIKSSLDFTVTTTSPNFKVHIKRNGDILETVDSTGTYSINTLNTDFNNSIITFEVEASGSSVVNVSSTFEVWKEIKLSRSEIENETISGSANFIGAGSGDYIVRDNLPTMKVIDFLSDLFKRFNLVATIDADLNLNTEHFDYHINKGNTIDISKYVDMSNHKISRPNFYSGLRFTTEPVKTVGEYGFQKVNGRKYGELKYNIDLGDRRLEGENYKVDLKSNIIPMDIPTNVSSGADASFQTMLLIDRKGEEVELGATFFYTKISNNRDIAFDDGSLVYNADDYIHQPSEVYYEDEGASTFADSEFTIGNYFSAEISVAEAPSFNFQDANLFNAFYSKAISIAFGETSRRARYEAYLPMKVLHSLSTSDIIVIANKYHIIESYSTNFLTGKTSLELMQVDESVIESFDTQSVNVVSGSSSKSSNFISADTGEATHVFTDNTTFHNVIGGESGVYRVQD